MNHPNLMIYPSDPNALIKKMALQLYSCCTSQKQASQEAWWMLEKITNQSKANLITKSNLQLTQEQLSLLRQWIEQRVKAKKPLQYILGSVPFCNLEIMVHQPVHIPRPETEEWVSWLIKQLKPVKKQALHILDLCTGSGCIALALADALPNSSVIGVDISPKALAVAGQNKKLNNINNVTFLKSDLYKELDSYQKFDLIVSNPPYVTQQEFEKLEETVKKWEDPASLMATENGLGFYKRIISQAQNHLSPTSTLTTSQLPRIVVETGTNPHGVKNLFTEYGFNSVSLLYDTNKTIRWIAAY